jgi:hypothetical protein
MSTYQDVLEYAMELTTKENIGGIEDLIDRLYETVGDELLSQGGQMDEHILKDWFQEIAGDVGTEREETGFDWNWDYGKY